MSAFLLHDEYRREAYWVRILEMGHAMAIAALNAWPITTPSSVLWHALIAVIISLVVAVAIFLLRPYRPEAEWSTPIKVANLLLLVCSALLAYVCLRLEEPDPPPDLERAYLGLNAATFALFILYFIMAIATFFLAMYRDARKRRMGFVTRRRLRRERRAQASRESCEPAESATTKPHSKASPECAHDDSPPATPTMDQASSAAVDAADDAAARLRHASSAAAPDALAQMPRDDPTTMAEAARRKQPSAGKSFRGEHAPIPMPRLQVEAS